MPYLSRNVMPILQKNDFHRGEEFDDYNTIPDQNVLLHNIRGSPICKICMRFISCFQKDILSLWIFISISITLHFIIQKIEKLNAKLSKCN